MSEQRAPARGGRGNRDGSTGRQQGRGRGHGRYSGRNNNRTSRFQSAAKKQGPKGECDELKDNIYSIGDVRQADKYTKTTEAILNYILKNYNNGSDVKKALEDLEDFNFDTI